MMNKTVDKYCIMEIIGKGQYGHVYRAENKITGELYAVKVMSLEKFKQTPKLSQFTENQIGILGKISHPNIIKFVQMLRTTNNYYLVYQYCNGGTLADYIKIKKRIPEGEALKIFAQLRSGFQILSKEKILHRDLKPTNILFNDGVLKIADFGFCKELMKNQMTQTMVGSPIYMAPEVLKGEVYDNRADIWSMGVVLYEMLYGFCPFEEGTIGKLISLIENKLLRFPTEISISNSTKILLKRMMTIKIRERINVSQLLAYDLSLDESDLKKSHPQINIASLKEILTFNRNYMTYLAEILDELVDCISDLKGMMYEKYTMPCFLVFKGLSSIQKDLARNSLYWDNLGVKNTNDQWDLMLNNEKAILEPFREQIHNCVTNLKSSYKLRIELETSFIDFKYFLEIIESFKESEQSDMRKKLSNCFLILRHYMLVFQKKVGDFTDYTSESKTSEQKEDICKKFAYTRT